MTNERAVVVMAEDIAPIRPQLLHILELFNSLNLTIIHFDPIYPCHFEITQRLRGKSNNQSAFR